MGAHAAEIILQYTLKGRPSHTSDGESCLSVWQSACLTRIVSLPLSPPLFSQGDTGPGELVCFEHGESRGTGCA